MWASCESGVYAQPGVSILQLFSLVRGQGSLWKDRDTPVTSLPTKGSLLLLSWGLEGWFPEPDPEPLIQVPDRESFYYLVSVVSIWKQLAKAYVYVQNTGTGRWDLNFLYLDPP